MRGMSKKNLVVGAAFVGVLASLGVAQSVMEKAAAAQGKMGVQAPYFEVDPMWPKPTNRHWLYGNVIGVGVDTKDRVYIIHRGAATLDRKEAYALQNPPMSECCIAAPPVVVFDGKTGALVTAWGGPGAGYEWPESNHGITPDSKGNVFIGGNGGNDGHVLKFTQDGKFVKQFGFAYAGAGSNDMWAFNKVAKVSLDEKANEAYVSDGYGNKRVAVMDMDTGKIKRYWGAYGEKPDDTNMGRYDPNAPLIKQFRNPVHCAEPSNDGNVYIRMIAISRIMLPNIKNIQASWLTVGKQTAQICLHGGANDFGSIMLEENVVSAAGAPHRFTYKSIQEAIKEGGFEPQLRNQQYEWRTLPEIIEEQVIDY